MLGYLLCFITTSFGQVLVIPKIADHLHQATSIKLEGFIKEILDASYQHRILAQNVDRLVAPFRNRTETSCWQSEFWGKWFTSAALAYRYRPEPELKNVLDNAVTKLLATQTPNGYIGNYVDSSELENWDIWGRKYCMLGLLAYYDITGNIASLQAAGKEADYLISELADKKVMIIKKGNHRGMAATSVLEPIVLLYSRTGDKRYLLFAQEIVRQWETPEGPKLISKSTVDVAKRFPKPKNWWGWQQGQKAYEMMSCYEGLLEFYRITGKSEYKEAVENTWKNIHDKEINIVGSGASVECWFGGKNLQTISIKHYQETCVTATWIKLSQQLLKLTGEAKYADAIEQTYYNALLGATKPDGSDWAKYSTLAGQRLLGGEQCGMGLNCCVASGPRALFSLPYTIVMTGQKGVSVNFFVQGKYNLKTPLGQQMELYQQTDYPVTGKVEMNISILKNEVLSIDIRIPAWSEISKLYVNGKAIDSVKSGEYAMISREWKTGDKISLELDMRGRIVRMGNLPENIAVVRGPMVLARDNRISDANVDDCVTPLPDKDGFINLEPVSNIHEGIWMQFKAPFSFQSHKETGDEPGTLQLCDFASAGNTFNLKSWFRVWLPQLWDAAK